MLELERVAIARARAEQGDTPRGQQLAKLEAELAKHLEGREILEMEIEEAKEARGMITQIAEKWDWPLNRVILAFTLAIEGAAYAAGAGVQLARRNREEELEMEAEEATPETSFTDTSVEVGSVSVELSQGSKWVRLVRTHSQKGETVSQEMRTEVRDLGELARHSARLYKWATRVENQIESKAAATKKSA